MSDFNVIKTRLFEREVYGYNGRLPLSRPLAIAHTASQQPDGSWTDVDYDDRGRSSWDPAKHLSRTVLLLRASRHRDTSKEDVPKLLASAGHAQDFWLKRRPESDNWWHNTIGGPLAICQSLILFGDDLDDDDRTATLDILAGVEIGMTGQNRAWVSSINFCRGVLVEDAELVQVALKEIVGEVKVSDGPEGIQPGWSFHQHGPQLYQGNYGAHFLETVAPYATLLAGTQFEMSDEHVSILTNLALEGTNWMTWGSRMDYHVVGRFISSPHRSRWESEKLVEPCEHLADVNPKARDALLAFRDRLVGKCDPGDGAPEGNRFFWRSDFMVHRASNRYLSIRMSSTRTVRSEACNQEGLQNYHLGDGVTLFTQRGDEYDGIFPAWDWKRVPGVTCLRSDEPLPVLSVGKDQGADLFVGGASDGENGVAGMRSVRDGVSARKAWFCHDSIVVCLGADIASHARHPVTTSINQCLMKSDVHIGTPDGPEPFLYTDRLFGGLPWVHHDGIGYLLLQQMAVDVRREPQWGAWKDINANTSADRVLRDVFSIWIDHGFGPQDAHYAYAVAMGVDVPETAALHDAPPFEIVGNTSDAQIVKWKDDLTQAVFWKPGELQVSDGITLSVNQGCAMMVRRQGKGLALTVANPNQLSEQIEVQVRVGAVVTDVTVDYPKAGLAGSSVSEFVPTV
jgi:chondroitin AC lyase